MCICRQKNGLFRHASWGICDGFLEWFVPKGRNRYPTFPAHLGCRVGPSLSRSSSSSVLLQKHHQISYRKSQPCRALQELPYSAIWPIPSLRHSPESPSSRSRSRAYLYPLPVPLSRRQRSQNPHPPKRDAADPIERPTTPTVKTTMTTSTGNLSGKFSPRGLDAEYKMHVAFFKSEVSSRHELSLINNHYIIKITY